jgi:hypothetical protein
VDFGGNAASGCPSISDSHHRLRKEYASTIRSSDGGGIIRPKGAFPSYGRRTPVVQRLHRAREHHSENLFCTLPIREDSAITELRRMLPQA